MCTLVHTSNKPALHISKLKIRQRIIVLEWFEMSKVLSEKLEKFVILYIFINTTCNELAYTHDNM